MFATLARSWRYAVTSYGMVWANKSLLVFPIISGIAALLVLASFAFPLQHTFTMPEGAENDAIPVAFWIVLFCYYVVSFFVIVFFNSALVVCAMRVIQNQPVSISEGLSEAAKRWYAILGWAVVSAVVGVVLRMLESNDKIGRIVAALLGTAWTALTFFVIPVIVLEHCGPINAVKRSGSTLKNTWGTALTGNCSLGLIAFLLFLPVALVAGIVLWLGFSMDSQAGLVLGIGGAAILVLGFACLNSAASTIFKALLYTYATGKSLPATVTAAGFDPELAFKDA